ncbi:flagellar basal body L-ring protein FlgH [Vogesella sp. LIG4]|uniref:flagellar basal body L-ring protein FlgH n=1 Tax=Vogesella sp. LIG4 TaxID=1192162 RepID=UPI00082016E3|nr:flagellar basal body L-ring protein FlgH [Vogesella sp. LIG4]SCK17632.1 flagellar L-ring protein precursor FlgH [Vogesella sp. LIG4]
MKRALSVLSLPLLLAACTGMQPPPGDGNYDPPVPKMALPHGQAGGVYTAAGGWSLIADQRAYRVGDVLTVLLQETTQASKSAGTTLDKNSSTSVQPAVVLGSSIKLDASLDAQRKFDGKGTSTQQNTLQGAITVVVQQVLPNGLMLVKGEKSVTLNQGEEVIRLAGYVRSDDIDNSNQVSSLRVANARIQYFGKGALADAGNPGWLTRFFNSPWMPF